MKRLSYRLVDVFAAAPLAGNGLAVMITESPLETGLMQRLTQELRQFETIFLTPTADAQLFRARVFTMEEELDFAGHPLVGAAAVLHEAFAADQRQMRWTIALNQQQVAVDSEWRGDHASVTMRQAKARLIATIGPGDEAPFLAAFGLSRDDRAAALPLEVVTTGLAYLIVPVTADGLRRARIAGGDFEARLAAVGAKFAYVFDPHAREGRTWDNLGMVEDVATGSAAGPVADFLVRHGLAPADVEFVLRQGRFVGRPSEMRTTVSADGVALAGEVRMVATGLFDASVG